MLKKLPIPLKIFEKQDPPDEEPLENNPENISFIPPKIFDKLKPLEFESSQITFDEEELPLENNPEKIFLIPSQIFEKLNPESPIMELEPLFPKSPPIKDGACENMFEIPDDGPPKILDIPDVEFPIPNRLDMLDVSDANGIGVIPSKLFSCFIPSKEYIPVTN